MERVRFGFVLASSKKSIAELDSRRASSSRLSRLHTVLISTKAL